MIAYKLCGTCMCVRFSMSAVCKASSRVGSGELDEVEALLAEEGMADLDLLLDFQGEEAEQAAREVDEEMADHGEADQ